MRNLYFGSSSQEINKSKKLLNLSPAIEFDEARQVICSSPYEMKWSDFQDRFVTDSHRGNLANGLVDWVREAHSVVRVSHVWIGGSFASGKANPADVDAVMFFYYRNSSACLATRDSLLRMHPHIFNPATMKSRYGVDGACVALSMPPNRLVQFAAYWAMVYSNAGDGSRRAFYSIPSDSMNL